MERLTDIQRRCLNIATKLGNHNLLILGKVGAGKTHLLRYCYLIIRIKNANHKSVELFLFF